MTRKILLIIASSLLQPITGMNLPEILHPEITAQSLHETLSYTITFESMNALCALLQQNQSIINDCIATNPQSGNNIYLIEKITNRAVELPEMCKKLLEVALYSGSKIHSYLAQPLLDKLIDSAFVPTKNNAHSYDEQIYRSLSQKPFEKLFKTIVNHSINWEGQSKQPQANFLESLSNPNNVKNLIPILTNNDKLLNKLAHNCSLYKSVKQASALYATITQQCSLPLLGVYLKHYYCEAFLSDVHESRKGASLLKLMNLLRKKFPVSRQQLLSIKMNLTDFQLLLYFENYPCANFSQPIHDDFTTCIHELGTRPQNLDIANYVGKNRPVSRWSLEKVLSLRHTHYYERCLDQQQNVHKRISTDALESASKHFKIIHVQITPE